MLTTASAWHTPECPTKNTDLSPYVGKQGDALVPCRGCKQRALIEDAHLPQFPGLLHRLPGHTAPDTPSVPAPEPPPARETGYRCRIHQDRPVNAQGKGCRLCRKDQQERAEAREQNRKKRARAAARA